MDEQTAEAIRRYYREHEAKYTPEAIRQGLLAAGHTAEQIDAALATPGFDTRPPTSVRGPAALIALVLFIGAAVLVGFVFGNSGGTYVPNVAGSTLIALIYFLPGFLISLVAIAVIARRPVARGRLVSSLLVALAIPVLIVFGMAGFCLAGVRGA